MAADPRRHSDMTGWSKIGCFDADMVRRQGAGLSVASTVTDPDGLYGSPLTFTEWWWCNEVGQLPVLRDYLTPDGCSHYLAVSRDAALWPDDDGEA